MYVEFVAWRIALFPPISVSARLPFFKVEYNSKLHFSPVAIYKHKIVADPRPNHTYIWLSGRYFILSSNLDNHQKKEYANNWYDQPVIGWLSIFNTIGGKIIGENKHIQTSEPVGPKVAFYMTGRMEKFGLTPNNKELIRHWNALD